RGTRDEQPCGGNGIARRPDCGRIAVSSGARHGERRSRARRGAAGHRDESADDRSSTVRASQLSTRWTRTLAPWVIGLLMWQPIAAGQSSGGWSALDAQSVALYASGDLAGAIEAAEGALRIAATPAQSGRSLAQLGFLVHT